jgi:integrase
MHINVVRSALSSFIFIDAEPVGQHPVIKRLLKGIFNVRPYIKSEIIWDPEPILVCLKSVSPAAQIGMQQLIMKLLILLALITGQRQQWLSALNVRNIKIDKKLIEITTGDLMKTSRPNYHQPQIKIQAYRPDKRLCPVHYLKEYLKRTAQYRTSDKLFLTTQKPYSPAAPATLSKWLRKGLSLAGLDMSQFTPHSTRSAATSAMNSRNVPMTTILKSAGWSTKTTFQKFYCKALSRKPMGLQNLLN